MRIRIFEIFIAIILFIGMVVSNTSDPELNKKYKITQIKPGDGKNFPQRGERLKVHYVGTLPTTGVKFDSSRDRKMPFEFEVGRGQVIKCWDEVMIQLSLGEIIEVICPYQYAYGERGAGDKIPPKSDLKFEVELLGISKSEF